MGWLYCISFHVLRKFEFSSGCKTIDCKDKLVSLYVLVGWLVGWLKEKGGEEKVKEERAGDKRASVFTFSQIRLQFSQVIVQL